MDVRLPNGVVIQNVPEGATKDEIRAKAIRSGLAKPEDFGETSAAVAQIPTEGYNQEAAAAVNRDRPSAPSWVDYALQGAAAVPVMAAGARGLQLVTRGSKAAPYTKSVADVLMPQTGRQLAFEGTVGATAGALGGLAGEQAPEGWQRDLVAAGVGMAAGAPLIAGRNALDLWVSRGLGGESLQATGAAADTLGKAQASAQALTALKANPNLGPTVLRAQEIEKNTGVSLPMLAAANGDTTISSYLQSQTSRGTNAEFTASLKQQYEAAEAALKKAKRGVTPSMEEVDAYVKTQANKAQTAYTEAVSKAQATSQRRQEGLDRIDDRLTELTSGIVAPSRTDTGTAIRNLIDAKEAAIKSELGPLYNQLLETATEQGIKLPAQAATELRNFTSEQMNRDVFQKFPKLFSLIQKEFSSPLVVSPRLSQKYRFAKETAQPKDVPLTTLDSLKREVNRAVRDTDNKDDLRRLYLLKEQVSKAIDAVDPAFSQPYRAIDKEYATRLGLPFSEQGVIAIDRAKFVERTVPLVTSSPSALKQVMAVVGDSPEGLKAVEDAFLFKIANDRSIIPTGTGQLNTRQLSRYLNNPDTRKMLDQVPGLRERLERIGVRVDELQKHKANILSAERDAKVEKAENLWTQAFGTSGGMRGVVRNAMSNPQQFDTLLRTVEKDAVAKAGVKSALLEDVLQAPGDTLEVFKTNRQAFEKLFGQNQTNQIEMIVEASQRLKDNPFQFKVNINNITKTRYEELTGSKLETSLGEARNQVLSLPRAVLNHFSRYFQGRTSKSESAEMQKFLSNPKALTETAEMMAEFQTKGVTDKVLSLMGKIAKNYITLYPAAGAAGFIAAQGAPEPETYQPSQPGLLQGFGQPQR
jgi:hypothetical protein